MKNANRFSIILLALAVWVGVSLACGSEPPTSEPPKISTATSFSGITQPPIITQQLTNTPATTETPTVELYLGDAVQNYGYALTVLSVADPATPSMSYQAEAGKKLVALELLLSNISGDLMNVSADNATLLDTDGFLYPAELWAIEDEIGTVDLNPGEQTTGWIGFKIDENAIPAKIKFLTHTFADQIIQASLNPPPEGHKTITISLTPTIPSSKLGDVVEQFGYSLSATNVEDPTTPSDFYESRQGYKLVSVEISLGNVSEAKSLSVIYYFASLVDNNGFVYEAEHGERDGEINMLDLNVGERAKGWVSFTIPENATPAYLKYQLGFFSKDYLITGLAK
jgi:hypothetical protein